MVRSFSVTMVMQISKKYFCLIYEKQISLIQTLKVLIIYTSAEEE